MADNRKNHSGSDPRRNGRRELGRTVRQAAAVLAVAIMAIWPVGRAYGTTAVEWEWKANGQTIYGSHAGYPVSFSYPYNFNWSQSYHVGDPFSNGESIETQPSNWTVPNYPDGDFAVTINATPTANLDVAVSVTSVTLAGGGALNMQFGSGVTTGLFDIQTDGTAISVGGGGGSWPGLTIGGGMLEKSAGTGTSTIDSGVTLSLNGGTVLAASGTLELPGNSSGYTNSTFTAMPGATIDLAPSGATVYVIGSAGGNGGGTVRVSRGILSAGGTGATLTFPTGQFQWTGGLISSGSSSLVNAGGITLSGSGGKQIGGLLTNQGTIIQRDSGNLNTPFGTGFVNAASGVVDIQSDAGWTIVGGSGGWPAVSNYGVFKKTGGSGTSQIDTPFNNLGGTVQVDTGTLMLAGGGSNTGGTYIVAPGAVLDLTGGHDVNFSGTTTGSGGGTVRLSGNTLYANGAGTTLSFSAGLFQWTGGQISGNSGGITNAGFITLSGSGGKQINASVTNQGTIIQKDSGSLNTPFGSGFVNAASGVVDIQSDAGWTVDGGGGGWPAISNYGVFRKSAGTGTSLIDTPFYNLGGTVEVDSGTLSISRANGIGDTLAGTWKIMNGASLVVSGSAVTTNQGDVTLSGAGATFAPINSIAVNTGAFRVRNGRNFTTAGNLSNSGTVAVGMGSSLTVTGTYTQTAGDTLINGDLTISGASSFQSGTVRGIGTLHGNLVNTATVAPGNSPGQLTVMGDYTQSTAGVLEIELAGLNAGSQYDVLHVTGTATLDGTLSIHLLSGFMPAPGDTFTILSAENGVSGHFSPLDLPAIGGATWDVSYLPNAVTITAVPEPTSLACMALGAAVLLRRRRRR